MLEAEPRSTHRLKVIEDDVQGELFAANAVLLTAIRVNFDAHEVLHLFVEAEL